MTLIILRIDNQLQCIMGLTFVTEKKDFLVTTQSTDNDHITTFFAQPIRLITFVLKPYSRTRPRITLKDRTENFKRLLATNNFAPGALRCGSAEPSI